MRIECKQSTNILKLEKKKKVKKSKRKSDVFQQVFNKITTIINDLWLERNTDQHNPAHGQLRLVKIIDAQRTVPDLYSLRGMIMPEHNSQYYALDLTKMLERSYNTKC